MRFLLSLFVVLSFVIQPASAQRYTVTDLGTLGGGSSRATGINNYGQVVGWANTPNGFQRAFLYTNGSMQNLSLGGASSVANGINDNGQVVGQSEYVNGFGIKHAFLYSSSNGAMLDLFASSGNLINGYSSAEAINNNGEIVGWHFRGVEVHQAFKYSAGVLHDLVTLTGSGPGFNGSKGINDVGEVVGYSWASVDPIVSHAFLHVDGAARDLGTLGGSFSIAVGINLTRQIVGWSNTTNNVSTHATLWQNDMVRDLGTLGGDYSYANSINVGGQVVGSSSRADATYRAFVYLDDQIQDLNDLIDPNLGWTLLDATSINNSGQIVGYGTNSLGQEHAFLLNPVPEPATLLFVTFPLLIFRRQR